MKFPLRNNRVKRKAKTEEKNVNLNIELDNFGVKLIKAIGVVGVVLGFILLIVFYTWICKKIF